MKILLNLLSTLSLVTGGTSSILVCNNLTTQDNEPPWIFAGSIYKLTDEGTIDTSVGDGTGKLEDKTFGRGIYSIAQLSNGTILASIKDSIYELTDEGKFKTKISDIKYTTYSIAELSNGNIFATVADNKQKYIYKLNSNGTINSKIDNDFSSGTKALIQLANGNIFISNNSKVIYKLTDEGKIDTSIGNNGEFASNFDTGVQTMIQLSNGTILAGVEGVGSYGGSIYRLTDEGKIDTSIGSGTGKIENRTLDGGISAITQLSNGTILAGTGSGSIYKLAR